MKSAYCEEIEAALKQKEPQSDEGSYFDLQKYIGSRLKVLGIKSQVQRDLFKNGYSFSTLKPQEQLPIWFEVWKSATYFETRQQCIYFLEKHYKKFDAQFLWNQLQGWMFGIDNWAVSDGFSGICGKMMAKNSRELFERLEYLNKSENLWERRQSLVIPIYYYRKSPQPESVYRALAMVENLLGDSEYFVQKGLGWLLRELGELYPAELELFLYNHIKVLSPVAFTAATEKLNINTKEELKLMRKQHRAKQNEK